MDIGVASYGALGHVAPLDFQLVILGITRFTDSTSHAHGFLSSINLWPIFVIFAHSFPQGVIIVSKMPERSRINFNSTRTYIHTYINEFVERISKCL